MYTFVEKILVTLGIVSIFALFIPKNSYASEPLFYTNLSLNGLTYSYTEILPHYSFVSHSVTLNMSQVEFKKEESSKSENVFIIASASMDVPIPDPTITLTASPSSDLLDVPTPTPTDVPLETMSPSPFPTLSPTAIPTPTLQPTQIPTPVAKVDSNSDEIWDKIADCESHKNWKINTGNGYYGGLQFSLGAWQSVGGSGNPSDASREEQIEKGKKLQSARGWGVWGECAKRLGLI